MDKIVKTDAEWKKQLTREQFEVTRKHGTERAFSGKYHATKDPGVYACGALGSLRRRPAADGAGLLHE